MYSQYYTSEISRASLTDIAQMDFRASFKRKPTLSLYEAGEVFIAYLSILANSDITGTDVWDKNRQEFVRIPWSKEQLIHYGGSIDIDPDTFLSIRERVCATRKS